jgi:heptosyltransferase-3
MSAQASASGKRDPQYSTARHITVYRHGGLGDILLLTPALRALRSLAPRARITLIAPTSYGRILREWELADDVVDSADPTVSRLWSPADEELTGLGSPDIVIIYSRTPPQTDRIGAAEVLSWVPMPPRGRHAGGHLVDALGPAGAAYWYGPEDVAPMELYGGSGPVLLHPGAGAAWKRAPIGLFLKVRDRLRSAGRAASIVCGLDDVEVRTQLGTQVTCLRDLDDLVGRVRDSSAFIGNDSGPTHLAGLLGVPTVALFGPTDPLAWRPLGSRVRVVRTCSEPPAAAFRTCDDPLCMSGITSDHVLEALADLSEPRPTDC